VNKTPMEAKGRQVVAGLRGEVRRSIASLDDLLSRTGAPRPDRSDGDCQSRPSAKPSSSATWLMPMPEPPTRWHLRPERHFATRRSVNL
jgi:hypothetical protein